jgi:steroid delta-isomerase-like uncharacterized protein
MSNEQLTNIGRALIDGLNAHDLKTWAGLLADDFVAEYPGASSLKQEQAAMFNQAFLVAFPDLRFDVHRVIANDEAVVVQWTGIGTFTAPLATASGQTIPPTGKRASVPGVLLAEVKNGKIVKEQTFWDQVGLLTQLGVLPG